MNASSPTKSFDDAISRWERRIEGLRAVRELLADDPEFAKELAALMPSSNDTDRSETIANQSETACSLIVAYLRSRNNKWTTVEEISNAAGVRKGTVSYVLYDKANDGQFVKRDNPSGSSRKQWRVSPERG